MCWSAIAQYQRPCRYLCTMPEPHHASSSPAKQPTGRASGPSGHAARACQDGSVPGHRLLTVLQIRSCADWRVSSRGRLRRRNVKSLALQGQTSECMATSSCWLFPEPELVIRHNTLRRASVCHFSDSSGSHCEHTTVPRCQRSRPRAGLVDTPCATSTKSLRR